MVSNKVSDRFPFITFKEITSMSEDELAQLPAALLYDVYSVMEESPTIEDIDEFLGKVTFKTYLEVQALDRSSDGYQVELLRLLGGDETTPVSRALSMFASYFDQLKKLVDSFPEHKSPVVQHCAAMVTFGNSYRVQNSLQSVAEAWSCGWGEVLDAPCDLVLQCLDFLSAKASAEYFEYESKRTM